MAHVLISMSSHNCKLLFSILGSIREVVKTRLSTINNVINIPTNRELDATWLERVITGIRSGTTCGVRCTEDSARWTSSSTPDRKEVVDDKRNQLFPEMSPDVFRKSVTSATLILQLGVEWCQCRQMTSAYCKQHNQNDQMQKFHAGSTKLCQTAPAHHESSHFQGTIVRC